MRTRSSGIGMLAAALSAMVASPADALQRVPDTLLGERVRVTLDAGDERILGSVTAIGPSAMQLADSLSGSRTLAYDEIDRLERSLGRTGNSRKGFLWGVGIGFGLGLVGGGVMASSLCHNADSCERPVVMAIVIAGVVALPAGFLGARMGAASSSERWEIVPVASAQDFGFRVRLPSR